MPDTIINSQQNITRKRGKLLTIWLILMIIGNTLIGLAYIFWPEGPISAYPNAPAWIFYFYGVLGLANTIFAVFLMNWKKWAFFAFCGSTVITFILNIIIGVGISAYIFGLTGPVILYLLLRTKFQLFE